MSERGPVGGAGELTALSEGEIRTIIYDALKNQFPAEGAAIMVAGCCAKPVLDALNKALAAKAPQGVPTRREQLRASAERVRQIAAQWREQAQSLRVSATGYALGELASIVLNIEASRFDGCADELERALPPSTGEKS